MKRSLRYALPALAGVLVLIQFVPVERTNPPVTADLVAPADVKAVLKESCYDCHSNETVWPWYSTVAPVSWMLVRDIEEARDEYNLSEWERMDAEEQAETREEMWEMASEGEMPPWSYLLVHPESRVTEADLAVLRPWLLAGTEEHDEKERRRRRRRGRD